MTHIRIPLKEPFRISSGEVTVKDAIVVRLESDLGEGIGESSPMAAGFGYSKDTPEGCWEDLEERILPKLLGRSFEDLQEIDRFASALPGSRFAVVGAETALWDLFGKVGSKSIAELLGATPEAIAGGVESGLAVGLYPSVAELLQRIERYLADGYKRVKIKIQPGRDVELARAVREKFGPIPLMVDANAAYNESHIPIFQELDKYDLMMFEQPMATHDIEASAKLQAVVKTPICIDESAETLELADRAIRSNACRIVNIKIQRVGGLGAALRLYDLCHASNIPCWVGTMPELAIGQFQGIHLATLPNCRFPTDVEPSDRWFTDDFTQPAVELSAPGILPVPTGPGLGRDVDPEKIRRYHVRHREFASNSPADRQD